MLLRPTSPSRESTARIPLLAIAAGLIYFFTRPTEQVVQQGVTTVQSLTVGGLDIGRQVTDSITNLRTTQMPTLNQLFDKVLAIPGVSEVLMPTIDALRAKLAVLTA